MKVGGFKDPQGYSLPVLIAVGLHLVLLIVMSTQWIASQEAPRVKPIKAISAKVIQVENQQAKKRKEDKVRRQKQATQKANKKRKDDARKKAERKKKLDKKRAADKKAKALAAKKAAKKKADAKHKADLKKKADAKRKAAADKKRAAEAEKQRQDVLASEARQQAAQEALNAALQEELVAEQASADQAAMTDYVQAVIDQIKSNWRFPPSARRIDKLTIRLQLLPTGEVAAVTVTKSSGKDALDRSVEQAVHRAKPFTVPKDARLFEKMRVLNINMSPENARW